jgi:hypothetical protein
LAGFLAFELAPDLQRQIYILNRHNARIYALAWRLGPKGGLPRKLRLRAPRRVGRPPLPRLLAGERHKIWAFSNFQGLAAFSMRRPARLGEMPDPRRDGRRAGPLPRKRLDLPALERRQALKRPAFCAALALIHRDPPLHFCFRKLNDAVFPYGFLLAVYVAFHFTMNHSFPNLHFHIYT